MGNGRLGGGRGWGNCDRVDGVQGDTFCSLFYFFYVHKSTLPQEWHIAI